MKQSKILFIALGVLILFSCKLRIEESKSYAVSELNEGCYALDSYGKLKPIAVNDSSSINKSRRSCSVRSLESARENSTTILVTIESKLYYFMGKLITVLPRTVNN